MSSDEQKAKSKDYYEKNVQAILEKREAYRNENRDQINKKKRKSYRDIAEIEKEKSSKYRKDNAEEINAYNRGYREANLDRVREIEKRSRDKKKQRENPIVNIQREHRMSFDIGQHDERTLFFECLHCRTQFARMSFSSDVGCISCGNPQIRRIDSSEIIKKKGEKMDEMELACEQARGNEYEGKVDLMRDLVKDFKKIYVADLPSTEKVEDMWELIKKYEEEYPNE